YPVTHTALPDGFKTLTVPKTALEFTPQQVAQQRAEWINSWQRAVSR
ncbi:MAG: thiamine ABC transporter substrate-binding protein, partial [Pantoea sp.]|nr:thiamine ABC transporter substrate-binding protein [Pantoea sp.]